MEKDVDALLFGSNVIGQPLTPTKTSTLGNRFIVPPFSILDTRQDRWDLRKRAWRALGLRGEEGRQVEDDEEKGVAFSKNLDGHGGGLRTKFEEREKEKARKAVEDKLSPSERKRLGVTYRVMDIDYLRRKEGKRKPRGDSFNIKCGEYRDASKEINTGTSIFDPCLCELSYRWFCLPGGSILDPFAGGSTRGVVAEVMGYKYTGIEIRENQIEANIKQATKIGVEPNWVLGDSLDVKSLLPKKALYDLVFTCPPYYDLEVYSIDSRDGSAHETYEEFLDWYWLLFKRVLKRLKDNRFFVVVVGEIRDKKTGAYRNFVGDSTQIFKELGLHYYNEMILITSGGSLPLRAGRQFEMGRKIGKNHQNVLVFYKGDLTKIKQEFGSDEYIKATSKLKGPRYGTD